MRSKYYVAIFIYKVSKHTYPIYDQVASAGEWLGMSETHLCPELGGSLYKWHGQLSPPSRPVIRIDIGTYSKEN